MQCNEIRERFVELLYEEGSTPASNAEILGHIHTCAACRRELEDLKQTRECLQAWKDESPLQSVRIPGHEAYLTRRSSWVYLRYAAIAAMALICILALANFELTWNKSGFSISTHIFPQNPPEQDHYTKTEVRDLVKRALDDSEFRMNEVNYLMMQKTLDTVEQDRLMDLRLTRKAAQNRNRN
jgi:hypothetical protein